MSLREALLWLVILSLLWMRTAVWIDAAVGYNFGLAFIGGGLVAGAVTAGLHHLVDRFGRRG
jgi:hypothetical protein